MKKNLQVLISAAFVLLLMIGCGPKQVVKAETKTEAVVAAAPQE